MAATSVADLLRGLGLENSTLRDLDRLSLRLRRPAPGGDQGRRRSPRTGSSVEFADYRSYVPGDDVRRIDWNAFARSDRLSLRLTVAEQDSTTNLLVDCSRSMGWGRPAKGAVGAGIAAGLVWVALRGEDRACVVGFGSSVTVRTPVVRGRGAAGRLWKALAGLPEAAATEPAAVAAAARRLRPGATVVISDFLTEAEWGPALAALRSAQQEVVLIQVLAPDEVEPEVSGDLRLRDLESGAAVDVTVTPRVLAAYREALLAHTESLAAAARAHGAAFVRVLTTTGVRDVLMRDLRQAGVLQR